MSTYRALGLLLALCITACVSRAEVADSTTETSTRTIVIGDVHGDEPQLRRLLLDAKLISKEGEWIGGDAHLIQTGDLTDRGPTSKRAIELLESLSLEAANTGGRVTVLLGNHDMMNVVGDLRYVHPGEYQVFVNRQSHKLQNNYYKQVKEHERKAARLKGAKVKFDRAHREAFEQKFPLGYVEHRLAWAPTGELGRWAIARPAVFKHDGVLYVHGGISTGYQDMGIEKINTLVRTAMIESSKDGILYDEDGPLWFRGWARWPETQENDAHLDAVLSALAVKRIVVGHTPLSSTVVPRFNAKVLLVDVGLAEHYGSGNGVLELVDGRPFVRHGESLIEIPEDNESRLTYLKEVSKYAANPERVLTLIAKLEEAEIEPNAVPPAVEARAAN